MKKAFLILLSILLVFTFTACQPQTETKYLQTSVTQEYVDVMTFRTESEYDDKGTLLTFTQYIDGAEISRVEYSYTDNSVIGTITQDGETSTMKQVYEKDEAGNIIRTEMYMDDELYSVTERTYDEKGNCLTNVQNTIADGRIYTTSYAYDENGNQTSVAYDYGEGVGTYTANIYDYDNRLAASYIKDLNGILTSTEKHSWNEEGIETVEVYDSEGNRTSKTLIEYDEFGNILSSVTFDALGNLTSKISYTYEKFEIPVE